MICKRCGQCCYHLDIFIINPESVLPNGTLNPDDPVAMIFKPAKQSCPHFICAGSEGEMAVCAIHHLSCYKGTPCEQFEQLGAAEDVCIMSGYFQSLGR